MGAPSPIRGTRPGSREGWAANRNLKEAAKAFVQLRPTAPGTSIRLLPPQTESPEPTGIGGWCPGPPGNHDCGRSSGSCLGGSAFAAATAKRLATDTDHFNEHLPRICHQPRREIAGATLNSLPNHHRTRRTWAERARAATHACGRRSSINCWRRLCRCPVLASGITGRADGSKVDSRLKYRRHARLSRNRPGHSRRLPAL